MFSLKERFKNILIRDHIIKEEDFNKALEEQKKVGGDLTKILVKHNLITETEFTQLLSEGLGLPLIDLSRLKIDTKVVNIISRDIAIKYQIMPISKMGDYLTLAMADPLNIFVIDNINALTGFQITPIISRAKDIIQAIETYYAVDAHVQFEEIIKDIKDNEEFELIEESGKNLDKEAIESLSQEAPIIKLTDAIIKQSVSAKASDIFVEPQEKTLRVRYRIDGVIRVMDQMSKDWHFPVVSRIKVISNLDISEHRLPQDGRFRVKMDSDKEVDFRVNVLPTAYGEKVVLRVLDKTAARVDITKLGFEPDELGSLKRCSQRPHGMILICGPTGSGKTTTLYSILNFIDSPEKNVITIEDPVEYQMKGVNQVNIKPALGLTFVSALRSILRQDPDVIMIGEIRDTETLDIAVKAALTGHLVLSSLHTTTASGSIIRMMNMGIEPYLICSSVIAIVAQRLVRKICPHCKESNMASKALIDKLNLRKYTDQKDIMLFRGKGCPRCLNSGYSGRIVISELLVLTPVIKELILTNAGELKIKEAGREEGMRTMREDALVKAINGLTSLEEVLRVTVRDE